MLSFNPKNVYDFELNKTLDEKVLLKSSPALDKKAEEKHLKVDVTNTDRTFGTIFGSEITRNIGRHWKMTDMCTV